LKLGHKQIKASWLFVWQLIYIYQFYNTFRWHRTT